VVQHRPVTEATAAARPPAICFACSSVRTVGADEEDCLEEVLLRGVCLSMVKFHCQSCGAGLRKRPAGPSSGFPEEYSIEGWGHAQASRLSHRKNYETDLNFSKSL
jgi:hypothetical protein